MRATTLLRRDRAIRFGLVGSYVGLLIFVMPLLLLNAFQYAIGGDMYPSTFDELRGATVRLGIVMGALALIGIMIGALTARPQERILGWRLVGSAIIAGSLLLLWWLFAEATPTALGWGMGLHVCISGVATGALCISKARYTVIDQS